jgi:hypothetical protein
MFISSEYNVNCKEQLCCDLNKNKNRNYIFITKFVDYFFELFVNPIQSRNEINVCTIF